MDKFEYDSSPGAEDGADETECPHCGCHMMPVIRESDSSKWWECGDIRYRRQNQEETK